jgi:hypothetical protein
MSAALRSGALNRLLSALQAWNQVTDLRHRRIDSFID